MFEVITSEASYLKSLDILVSHFMMSKVFLPNPNLPSTNPNEFQLIDRQQYHFLFSGVSAVKSVSERLVAIDKKPLTNFFFINSLINNYIILRKIVFVISSNFFLTVIIFIFNIIKFFL